MAVQEDWKDEGMTHPERVDIVTVPADWWYKILCHIMLAGAFLQYLRSAPSERKLLTMQICVRSMVNVAVDKRMKVARQGRLLP